MKSISKDFDLKRFVSHNIRELTLFAILIVISILVQVRTGGRFLSGSNLNDLLRETAILMMVSVGMMMVILTGCIDLSLGSTMGLAGMCPDLKGPQGDTYYSNRADSIGNWPFGGAAEWFYCG